VPEGHSVHRIARQFDRHFVGLPVAVSSPQGRFAADARLVDGRVMTEARAVGKQLFLGFDHDLWMRVHLGMYGAWDFAGDITADATTASANGRMGQTNQRGTFTEDGPAPATPGPRTAGGLPSVVGAHEDSLHSIGAPRRSRLRMAESETLTPTALDAAAAAFPPEPVGQVRARLLTERTVADLRGPTACEVIDGAGVAAALARLGPDPLVDPGPAGEDRFVAAVRTRATPIGLLLMDQAVVAGVGNVYRAELLFRARREHGEICSFNVFNRKMVAVFGPEAHEAVFRAPDSQLSPSEAYKIMTPVFGKGIVYDATPERMAEQLKMLLPALKDRRMRTYGEAVVREVQETTEQWGEAGVLDFVAFCRVLTNYTSSRCLLGKEFREGMNEEFAEVYTDLERGVTPLAYINAHLPIPSFRARDKARVRMVEMITRIVDARRREKREGEDFLQTLMDSRYVDGRALTEDEITGMLLAGMFAGHHTSSVTTAWALLELIRNPETMRRIRAEIDQVFGGGKPVSHALLRELSYTENVVKETLRLHPPLFMLVRVAQKDFHYKDYFIPAGSWVLTSPTVSHMIPEIFAEPERFDPDRFAPPRSEDKQDFAFIAFGGGRHKCLGNAFAILQIKAILAMLLGQYDFELGGDEVASDFHGLVIGPKEPCRVRYRRRQDASVTIATASELVRTANDLENAVAKVETGDVAGAAVAAGCPAHVHAPAVAPAAVCPVDHGQMAKPATAMPEAPAAVPAAAESAAPRRARKAKKALAIVLDTDLCQGHAVCVGECSEVFLIGADGKVAAKTLTPPIELNDKVREAARHCPTRAIKLEELP